MVASRHASWCFTLVRLLLPVVFGAAGACSRQSPAGLALPRAAAGGRALLPFGCHEPDYGIHWYGPGNRSQKAVKGQANPYYDPHKKTVLLAHGFTFQEYTRPPREWFFTFDDPASGAPLYTAAAWVAAGWNVGVFDWRAFSDEDWVIDAEDKVWGVNADGQLPWRRCDGLMTTEHAPTSPVPELLYANYLQAMADYQGDEVRLVGPSLGSQVAARLTGLLVDGVQRGAVRANLLPKRVALLDPFWSNHLSDASPVWRGESTRQIIAKAKAQGVIWERTQVSDFTLDGVIGDQNTELNRMIGLMHYDLAFLRDWNPVSQIMNQHFFAEKLYFLQFDAPVPRYCSEASCRPLVSSAASDDLAKAFMDASGSFVQTSGMTSARSAQLEFAPVR